MFTWYFLLPWNPFFFVLGFFIVFFCGFLGFFIVFLFVGSFLHHVLSSISSDLHRVLSSDLLWVLLFVFNFLRILDLHRVLQIYLLLLWSSSLYTWVPCGKNISMSAIDLESLRLDFFTELEFQRLEMLVS